MNKENEILLKINSIESTMENIYKEIIEIRREMEYKHLEQFQVMSRLENIADFIQDRYDVVVEEKEKFNKEKMEKKNLM